MAAVDVLKTRHKKRTDREVDAVMLEWGGPVETAIETGTQLVSPAAFPTR